MEPLSSLPPRQALCGNVFPGDDLTSVLAALRGPVRDWAQQVGGQPGFGLYLSANATAETLANPEGLASLRAGLDEAQVDAWTANAFPFAGFHGSRVKEQAFLPDWRDPQRLQYTLDVAELLVSLRQPGDAVSVSTCPLGYGVAAREDRSTVAHLRQAQESFLSLEEKSGVQVLLGLEPEPEGALECAAILPGWLAAEVLADVTVEERRLGLCWDLCHSAVVGESAPEVLAALAKAQVPMAKIQVSSALIAQDPHDPACRARLSALAEDPWFHQVRAGHGQETIRSWPDLADALLDSDTSAEDGPWRIHCHVPIHRPEYGQGLAATDWRSPLTEARAADFSDFEVETYTLPILPPEWLEAQGIVGTLVAETHALAATLEVLSSAT